MSDNEFKAEFSDHDFELKPLASDTNRTQQLEQGRAPSDTRSKRDKSILQGVVSPTAKTKSVGFVIKKEYATIIRAIGLPVILLAFIWGVASFVLSIVQFDYFIKSHLHLAYALVLILKLILIVLDVFSFVKLSKTIQFYGQVALGCALGTIYFYTLIEVAEYGAMYEKQPANISANATKGTSAELGVIRAIITLLKK